MALLVLKSDKQFISPSPSAKDIRSFEYNGEMNEFGIIQPGAIRRVNALTIYKSLQLFGVTIEGDRFGELARELRGIEEGNYMDVFVNRLGLCVIARIKHPSIKGMRINDYFGWSKYGERVPRDMISSTTSNVWNRLDMFNGETMMDVGGIVKAAEEAKELRRSLEEERMELTACRKELEWMKKNESLWGKLLEDKENQLLAFKAALSELVD